jgi:hypothetical protein
VAHLHAPSLSIYEDLKIQPSIMYNEPSLALWRICLAIA